MFFFEKKNQKTFTSLGLACPGEAGAEQIRVFCFFSSEKKAFYISRPARRRLLRSGSVR
jgi:hypothetical protein